MHILLALDQSPCAQAALGWAKAVPLPPDTRFTLIHVLEPADLSDALGPNGLHLVREHRTASAHVLLTNASKFLGQRYAHVDVVLSEGLPIYEILRCIRETAPDLVISGMRGLMETRGLILGSVSQRLLHYAPCSVMLMPARPRMAIKPKVMVATDGSRGSDEAARFVARFFKPTEVTVFSAVRSVGEQEVPLEGVAKKESRKILAQIMRQRREAARKAVLAAAQMFPPQCRVITRIVAGHPTEVIARTARQAGCDLLALGSRGLRGMEIIALGSVSVAVAQAPCAVLIVKSPAAARR
jgi:nucleotide-binding universal stress UspA family protein